MEPRKGIPYTRILAAFSSLDRPGYKTVTLSRRGGSRSGRALPFQDDNKVASRDVGAAGLLQLIGVEDPYAVRLLALMFPRDTAYRRSVTSLQAEGFIKRALARLLKRLIDTGFLSKEPGQAGVVTTYRLHLAAAWLQTLATASGGWRCERQRRR
jgi:hypothetical protein